MRLSGGWKAQVMLFLNDLIAEMAAEFAADLQDRIYPADHSISKRDADSGSSQLAKDYRRQHFAMQSAKFG